MLTDTLDIYGPSRNIKKSKGYHALLPAPGAFSIHTAIDKSMHRRKRKVLAQGLSDDVLKMFEPALLACIKKFCEKLAESQNMSGEGWTQPKNMTHWCEFFLFMSNFEQRGRTLLSNVRQVITLHLMSWESLDLAKPSICLKRRIIGS